MYVWGVGGVEVLRPRAVKDDEHDVGKLGRIGLGQLASNAAEYAGSGQSPSDSLQQLSPTYSGTSQAGSVVFEGVVHRSLTPGRVARPIRRAVSTHEFVSHTPR